MRDTWLTSSSFLAVTVLLAATARGQTVLITAPTEPVPAGGDATMVVYFLNDTKSPMRVPAADELAARLAWTGGTSEVALRREEEGAAAELAPGGFVRVPYRVTVPAAARGQTTITVPGSPPAVLSVTSPTGVIGPAPVAPAGAERVAARNAEASRPEIVEYFANHFSAYEPMYIVSGNEDPSTKFQFSFKYRIFNKDASVARAVPPLGALYFAYSQTSFWDLGEASGPFFDSSYRPEAFFYWRDVLPFFGHDEGFGAVSRVGLQFGVQHESNGQDGADSRSINFVYVRPTIAFGPADRDIRDGDVFLTVGPRFHAYFGDDGDNPDVEEFRGYGDLQVVLGQHNGLQLAATGRIGADGDKGSLQLDLSYPLRPLLRNNLDVFLHAQFFTGYGESLLLYNENDTTFRMGISLVR